MVKIIHQKQMNHLTHSKLKSGMGAGPYKIRPQPDAIGINDIRLINRRQATRRVVPEAIRINDEMQIPTSGIAEPTNNTPNIEYMPLPNINYEAQPIIPHVEAMPADNTQPQNDEEENYEVYRDSVEDLLNVLDSSIDRIDNLYGNMSQLELINNANTIKDIFKKVISLIRIMGFIFNVSYSNINSNLIDNVEAIINNETFIDKYNNYIKKKSNKEGFRFYKAFEVNPNLISKIQKVLIFIAKFNNVIANYNLYNPQVRNNPRLKKKPISLD
jgi:hypothetical protein